MQASLNTPVYSPYAGTVEKLYTAALGGNQLIILHDNGYRTGYAHLNSYNVAQGDKVTAGEQIALSGNTGTATTGAHLHFVLVDPTGTTIDPVGIIYPAST